MEPVLVVLSLRGGCDGLNFVGPAGDKRYIAERIEELRVNRSGNEVGLVLNNPIADVDFRIHHMAKHLKEIYDQGQLAIIHACGLTNGTRSHFEAIDYMERGTPDNKLTPKGWLTRHIENVKLDGKLPVASISASPPATFLGYNDAVAVPDIATFQISIDDRSKFFIRKALHNYYRESSLLSNSVNHTLGLIDNFSRYISYDENYVLKPHIPENGAVYDESNEAIRSLRVLAQLIKMDIGLKYVTVDFGGWDTHIYQANYFPYLVLQLSEAIFNFWKDMERFRDKITIVIMSEFGRRLKSNESRGTDHGHGNIMMVVSGNMNGGRMYGKWPGLATEALDEWGDLTITTDYRTILAEILEKKIGNTDVQKVFPGLTNYQPLGLFA